VGERQLITPPARVKGHSHGQEARGQYSPLPSSPKLKTFEHMTIKRDIKYANFSLFQDRERNQF